MTFNEVEYDLAQGILENYRKLDEAEDYNIDLVLISSGFVVHEVGGEIDSLSGEGHLIYFEMFTSDPNKLALGDYNYDPNETGKAGTFDDGGCLLNYDTQTEQGTFLEISGGKITVVQNGDTYEFNFDVITEGGKHITGFFKGSIKYYDYSDESSRRLVKQKHF